jgi:cytochrome c-type biogenesis protein CcmH
MGKLRSLVLAIALTLSVQPVLAVEPGEALPDPAQESRARSISAELRCLVCQNQSIDDSHAELAKDLRLLVRERIRSGDSDDQVRDFLVARSGDFILLKPPLKVGTLLLWGGPFGLLIVGAGVLLAKARRRSGPIPTAELSAEEQEALARLTGEPKAGSSA